MTVLKRWSVYVFCCAFALSGCVTTGPGGGSIGSTFRVGPELSSLIDPDRQAVVDETKPKLDIVIPVFDPGLSQAAEDYEEAGVWPELRRAEANRFAYKLKAAMEETGAFGAVRVVPDNTATGDLYVMGKIVESNGETVEIDLEVVDISGERWFAWTFDHEVGPGFHKNVRNIDKDPYDPVFEDAANHIALHLEERSGEELATLRRITDLRFGANLADEAFAAHMKIEGGQVDLISYPSDSDPMLRRTQAIRVRDQLFVDGLQDDYRSFSQRMETSYLIWQEQALLELQAEREAKAKAAGQAVMGIAVIALGVLAAAASSGSSNDNTRSLGVTAGALGAIGGASLISNSFQTSREAEVHRDALNELGESINVDLATQVIEFEEQTVSLTGDAKAQFAQWRAFLQKIYAEERTPNRKL